ncbi:MAG: tRNA pseudouridine(13) synthase TruD, partial [Candidatus Woesearchaeota archaeon]|nr:tRNA pseudouridine(13) synthase TruD [Candidatus Woesearchaeota archaeon]
LEKAAEEILCFVADNEFLDKKEFRQRIKAHWGKWAELVPQLPRGMHIEGDVLKWLEHNPTDFAGAIRNLPKHLRKLYVHAYQSWIFNKALLETPNAEGLLPVPGSKTVLGRDDFSKNVQAILEKEEVLLTNFECERMPELRSEGDTREARIKIQKLEVGPAEPDEAFEGRKKVTVSFSLPKGCYATVLLDQLFS